MQQSSSFIPPRRAVPPNNENGSPFQNNASLPPRRSISRNDIPIPNRRASIQVQSIDDLLNDGTNLLAQSRLLDAIEKWNQALQLALSEQDIIKQAKALSNISCAYRKLGKLKDAKTYLDTSWTLTTSYIRAAASKDGSNWLQLAIRATGLEGDRIENAFVTHSKVDRDTLSRPPSANNNTTKSVVEISNGPPIVVWILQLMTNMGNLCYARAKYELAMKCYNNCKRLVDSIFEEYPPPQAILNCFLKSNTAIDIDSPEPKSPQERRLFRLSYVHRHAILSQIHSLNHMGVCFIALGMPTAALQFLMASYTLLTEISDLVPALVPNTLLSPRTSSLSSSSSIESTCNIIQFKADIASNIAIAWKLQGDLAKSIEWHQKSLSYYEYNGSLIRRKLSTSRNREVGIDEVRQISRLAALHIPLGTALDSLQWLNEMKDKISMEFYRSPAASKYWNAPLNDLEPMQSHPTNRLASEKVFDRALGILYEQACRQKVLNDFIGLYCTWTNIAITCLNSQHPLLALQYLAKVVGPQNTVTLDNSNQLERPSLAPFMHNQVLVVILYTLFSLTHLPSEVLESPKVISEIQRIESFLRICLPNSPLDITKLQREKLIDFCDAIHEKLSQSFQSSTNALVTSLSKSLDAGDTDSSTKVDFNKSQLFRISVLKSRLSWNLASTLSGELSILWFQQSIQNLQTALNDATNQSINSSVFHILLSSFSNHIESNALSKSNVQGVFDYTLYALVSDMLGYLLAHPEIELSKFFRITQHTMSSVRTGLMASTKTLILLDLNSCEGCLKGECLFRCQSKDGVTIIPCVHGFVLE